MYIIEHLKTIEKYESYFRHKIYSEKYGKSEKYFVKFLDYHGAMIVGRELITNGNELKVEIHLRRCYADESESAFLKGSIGPIISLSYQSLRKIFGDNITITFENNVLIFTTNYETELSKWYDYMKKNKEESEQRCTEREASERAIIDHKSWSEMKPTFSLLTPYEQEAMRDQQRVYGIIDNWKHINGT